MKLNRSERGALILAGITLAYTLLVSNVWPLLLAIFVLAGALDVAWHRWIRDRLLGSRQVAIQSTVAKRQFRLSTAFELLTCTALVFVLVPQFIRDVNGSSRKTSPFNIRVPRQIVEQHWREAG